MNKEECHNSGFAIMHLLSMGMYKVLEDSHLEKSFKRIIISRNKHRINGEKN